MTRNDSKPVKRSLFPRLNRKAGSLAVLSCYLDDSDNDVGPVLSIGGIIVPNDRIDSLEDGLEACFQRYGVQVLHAFEMEAGKGEFKNWDGLTKFHFIQDVFQIAQNHEVVAIATTVNKANFRENLKSLEGFQNMSAIGYGFGRVASAITTKFSIRPDFFPIIFVIESGNKNSGNFVNYFNFLKRETLLAPYVQEVTFVTKEDCRAVHLADFIAFHARRLGEKWEADGYAADISGSPAIDALKSRINIHIERSRGDIKAEDFELYGRLGDGKPSPFFAPGKAGI